VGARGLETKVEVIMEPRVSASGKIDYVVYAFLGSAVSGGERVICYRSTLYGWGTCNHTYSLVLELVDLSAILYLPNLSVSRVARSIIKFGGNKMKVMQRLFACVLVYKQVLKDRAGSPTVEYVILIGVGAAVASLLAVALNGENNSGIIESISKKISQIIEAATTLKKDTNG
jgi:hypothetical protein